MFVVVPLCEVYTGLSLQLDFTFLVNREHHTAMYRSFSILAYWELEFGNWLRN